MTHYDPDTDCHYTPGGCSVGGTRTKPSLLTEYRQRYAVDGPAAAEFWLWGELLARHDVWQLNRWYERILRILEVA